MILLPTAMNPTAARAARRGLGISSRFSMVVYVAPERGLWEECFVDVEKRLGSSRGEQGSKIFISTSSITTKRGFVYI